MTRKTYKPRMKPLSLQEQRERMAGYKRWMEDSSKSDGFPLVATWKAIEERQSPEEKDFIAQLQGAHGNTAPLADLFYCVLMECYPPPELLMALAMTWKRYLEAKGDFSLEEAFLGKPKQRAGNYAKRAAIRRRNIGAAIRMAASVGSGTSKTEAAQELAHEFDMDVETFLRVIKPEK